MYLDSFFIHNILFSVIIKQIYIMKVLCFLQFEEILVCGGGQCYSYHTREKQLKLVCSYATDIYYVANIESTEGIKLIFIGDKSIKQSNYVFLLEYVSVWKSVIASKQTGNELIPFVTSDNKSIVITNEGDYEGSRAVIGGKKKNLLFITSFPRHIEVFDLNTCKIVAYSTLPIGEHCIRHHCFVKKKQNSNEMIFFYGNSGLSIGYDEDSNTFQFRNLRVCSSMRYITNYAYVYINDIILFFGGRNANQLDTSKIVHKYSITENTWLKFENTLTSPLVDACAISSQNSTMIYMFEGICKGNAPQIWHTHLSGWMQEETETEKQWMQQEQEKMQLEDIKNELASVTHEIHFKDFK
ncbi:hypothetical protein RFI_17423, partial [Reticulomyxa filosa]